MQPMTVEDLYVQSKVDEFLNYKLYVKMGDEHVPLVVHDIFPEENKLVLWSEKDLTDHLKKTKR